MSTIYLSVIERSPTDEMDFIIGDRVYAAGKPGIIAYLGEVKFATGDFAGVVLGKKQDDWLKFSLALEVKEAWTAMCMSG